MYAFLYNDYFGYNVNINNNVAWMRKKKKKLQYLGNYTSVDYSR
jgi:hypothetical protein